MKKLLIMIVLASAMTIANAQKIGRAGIQTIDISQVPDSVKSAQMKNFPGLSITRWELHAGKKKGQYIAEFVDGNNLHDRVRYSEDGKIVLTTKIYGPNQLPPVVVTASRRYENYRVSRAEEIFSPRKNKSWYSVRLLGKANKITVLLDESGNEILPDKAPEELQSEPSSPTNKP